MVVCGLVWLVVGRICDSGLAGVDLGLGMGAMCCGVHAPDVGGAFGCVGLWEGWFIGGPPGG